MSFRVSVDIGGTCTDVVVASDSGGLTLGKAMTTRQHPQDGLAESLADAARQLGLTGEEILASTDLFLYSTTRATNAILEGATATTALLVTEGFRDVLVRREGGSMAPLRLHPAAGRAVHPAPPHVRDHRADHRRGRRSDPAGRGRSRAPPWRACPPTGSRRWPCACCGPPPTRRTRTGSPR